MTVGFFSPHQFMGNAVYTKEIIILQENQGYNKGVLKIGW